MQTHGLDLHLGDRAKSLAKNVDGTLTVTLTSEAQVAADMVTLAISVRPNTQIAEHAGLTIGTSHGVLVDEHLRTSDPISTPSATSSRSSTSSRRTTRSSHSPVQQTVRHAGGIDRQGVRSCRRSHWCQRGTPDQSRHPFSIRHHPSGFARRILPGQHTSPYQTALHPEGKLLGAQAAGYDGVDKRIDVLATALRLGATVDDLTHLELAYAPPYGSAKDPVNMLDLVAQDDLEALASVATPDHLAEELAEGAILLDVREPEETSCGIIPGAVTIPLSPLRDHIGELSPERESFSPTARSDCAATLRRESWPRTGSRSPT